ncbi:MAG: ribosome maturation factor RimP [bacterium]
MYERVRAFVERVVREDGVELVDIQFPRFKARQLVRIFIDKEGGVTVDDCRRVSVKVGAALDIEDPFPGRYTLEVSSPGVDRPLKTLGDFRRNIGRTLRVAVSEGGDQQKAYTGVLKELQGETVVLQTAQGRVEVPLATITKARVCTAF